ncbi:hypothetical protein [Marinimicrobium sp. LS-A18]|uniref:hypothetical protein n=1 Tax=Marinimicrobium sp. LS-A18 TaxID=1381596 RepID=UPI000462F374|nr:hypothetical protein [Marinimicrobium sp. LS-A18]
MNNLKPLLFLIPALFLLSCSVAEKSNADQAFLPLSIDQVETYRVEEYLLRLIKHNMELEPRFELELIEPDEPKGVDRRELTSVTLNGETLNFAESAGVFVESMGVNSKGATLVLEYFHQRGGKERIECVIPVVDGKIAPPECRTE